MCSGGMHPTLPAGAATGTDGLTLRRHGRAAILSECCGGRPVTASAPAAPLRPHPPHREPCVGPDVSAARNERNTMQAPRTARQSVSGPRGHLPAYVGQRLGERRGIQQVRHLGGQVRGPGFMVIFLVIFIIFLAPATCTSRGASRPSHARTAPDLNPPRRKRAARSTPPDVCHTVPQRAALTCSMIASTLSPGSPDSAFRTWWGGVGARRRQRGGMGGGDTAPASSQ